MKVHYITYIREVMLLFSFFYFFLLFKYFKITFQTEIKIQYNHQPSLYAGRPLARTWVSKVSHHHHGKTQRVLQKSPIKHIEHIIEQ